MVTDCFVRKFEGAPESPFLKVGNIRDQVRVLMRSQTGTGAGSASFFASLPVWPSNRLVCCGCKVWSAGQKGVLLQLAFAGRLEDGSARIVWWETWTFPCSPLTAAVWKWLWTAFPSSGVVSWLSTPQWCARCIVLTDGVVLEAVCRRKKHRFPDPIWFIWLWKLEGAGLPKPVLFWRSWWRQNLARKHPPETCRASTQDFLVALQRERPFHFSSSRLVPSCSEVLANHRFGGLALWLAFVADSWCDLLSSLFFHVTQMSHHISKFQFRFYPSNFQNVPHQSFGVLIVFRILLWVHEDVGCPFPWSWRFDYRAVCVNVKNCFVDIRLGSFSFDSVGRDHQSIIAEKKRHYVKKTETISTINVSTRWKWTVVRESISQIEWWRFQSKKIMTKNRKNLNFTSITLQRRSTIENVFLMSIKTCVTTTPSRTCETKSLIENVDSSLNLSYRNAEVEKKRVRNDHDTCVSFTRDHLHDQATHVKIFVVISHPFHLIQCVFKNSRNRKVVPTSIIIEKTIIPHSKVRMIERVCISGLINLPWDWIQWLLLLNNIFLFWGNLNVLTKKMCIFNTMCVMIVFWSIDVNQCSLKSERVGVVEEIPSSGFFTESLHRNAQITSNLQHFESEQ